MTWLLAVGMLPIPFTLTVPRTGDHGTARWRQIGALVMASGLVAAAAGIDIG
jgi:hypothetical protein